jgi:hypothetical protein
MSIDVLKSLVIQGLPGHYETARRLGGTCGQVFRYAIATGRAERDISADLRRALIVPKVSIRRLLSHLRMLASC